MSTRTRSRARRLTFTVIKDAILFGVGTSLIIRQGFLVSLAEFNLASMIFGGVLANVPAAQYLWALRSGSTGLPTSPQALPPLSSPDTSSPNA